MRLFLAIELPELVRKALAADDYWTAAYDVAARSFVRAENLHLTLKFIGEFPEHDLVRLCDRLKECSLAAPFMLHASHTHCLPHRGPIRVLSAGLAGDLDPLHLLHGQVEAACAELRIARETRPFTPHVTIARPRRPIPSHHRPGINAHPLPAVATEPFVVSEFVLMQSHLESNGPRYVPLARFS